MHGSVSSNTLVFDDTGPVWKIIKSVPHNTTLCKWMFYSFQTKCSSKPAELSDSDWCTTCQTDPLHILRVQDVLTRITACTNVNYESKPRRPCDVHLWHVMSGCDRLQHDRQCAGLSAASPPHHTNDSWSWSDSCTT